MRRERTGKPQLLNSVSSSAGGQQDLRPAPTNAFPDLPASSVLLRNAAGISLRDYGVTWGGIGVCPSAEMHPRQPLCRFPL